MEGTGRTAPVKAMRPEPTPAWDAFLDCYLSTTNRVAVDTFLAGLASLGRRSAA